MPPINEHKAAQVSKVLIIGDTGGGKTGSILSLASAGYNVRIIDLENGLDVVRNMAMNAKDYGYAADTASRISYVTITERMKPMGDSLIPITASVWGKAIKFYDKWEIEAQDAAGKPLLRDGKKVLAEDFGPLTSWGPKDVLVTDSLTGLNIAAINFVAGMNGRLGVIPAHQSDWFQAQSKIESVLQFLWSDSIRCNIVMMAHIASEEKDGVTRYLPSGPGRALNSKIGRYFNSIILARSTGSGVGQKRMLVTRSVPGLDLKNVNPAKIPAELPLATGLAEFFRLAQS